MTEIDRDILITRVLDGEATPEDWAAFRAMAERDRAVWGELAGAQQDRAELASALAESIALADGIEAPIDRHAGERLSARFRTAVAWVGWAAAAMLGVSALISTRAPQTGGMDSSQASLFTVNTPEDALRLYLDKGQSAGSVIGEVPDRVLLSSSPTPDGRGYTVVYLRQIIERQRVEDFYRLGRNEAGQSVPVPYPAPAPPRSAW